MKWMVHNGDSRPFERWSGGKMTKAPLLPSKYNHLIFLYKISVKFYDYGEYLRSQSENRRDSYTYKWMIELRWILIL